MRLRVNHSNDLAQKFHMLFEVSAEHHSLHCVITKDLFTIELSFLNLFWIICSMLPGHSRIQLSPLIFITRVTLELVLFWFCFWFQCRLWCSTDFFLCSCFLSKWIWLLFWFFLSLWLELLFQGWTCLRSSTCLFWSSCSFLRYLFHFSFKSGTRSSVTSFF